MQLATTSFSLNYYWPVHKPFWLKLILIVDFHETVILSHYIDPISSVNAVGSRNTYTEMIQFP